MTDYTKKSSKKLTEDGGKAKQRVDDEDRSQSYRLWRREIGKKIKNGRRRASPYAIDIDQLEHIYIDDKPIPVALLEITRYDFDEKDAGVGGWSKYRQSILNRYFTRDAQASIVSMVSDKLECPAYIVLFRHDLKSFWLFDIKCGIESSTWFHLTEQEYVDWLVALKTRKMEQYAKISVNG